MAEIIRTPVHKRVPLHFLVDGLQVWVSYLDENEGGGPYGLMIRWMEHKQSVSPLEHITDDGGHTFRPFASYLIPGGGIDWRQEMGAETDSEKLRRLNRIWVEYQKHLGQDVFSV